MTSNRDLVDVAIICALSLEAEAVEAFIEQKEASNDHDGGDDSNENETTSGDTNTYTTGTIGGHKVVLAYLPSMGKVSATAAASSLKGSYKNIRLALLVGICAGVPGQGSERIMLGDVILSDKIVQYDLGTQFETGFRRKQEAENNPGGHATLIKSFINKLKSKKRVLQTKTAKYLSSVDIIDKDLLEDLDDDLYPADYWHIHRDIRDCVDRTCKNGASVCEDALKAPCEELGCDQGKADHHDLNQDPKIHFGPVGSGDSVIRSATMRDDIAKREKVIAFDMEAAGMWDYLPSLFVKGVCDYADSHKNKSWQKYAAASAAASVKAVLEQWNKADHDQHVKGPGVRNQFNNNNCQIANQGERIRIRAQTNNFGK